MSNQPRFLPPKGKEFIHLALTDGGHSCVIYPIDPADKQPGTIIPDRFRKLAVAEGCDIVGLNLAGAADTGGLTKTELVVTAIAAVMERQDGSELEGDGRPKLAAIKKQAGFGVTKAQLDDAWAIYLESLDGDEEDSQADEL